MAMTTVALLFLVLVAPAVHAVEHVVGGNAGWSLNQNYQTWAAGKTFAVGDTLVFRYDNTHTVDIVKQEDYNECDTGDAIRKFNDGNTTIPLQTPGPMYFICPVPGHCTAGMKLAINVQAAGTGAGTGTGTAPGGSPTPTAPSGSTPTTPGPGTTSQSSGGVSVFGEVNHLMLVASAVMAAMLVLVS